MSISKTPWTYGQNEQNRFIKDATGNCIVAYNRAMFSAEDAQLMAAAPSWQTRALVAEARLYEAGLVIT